MYEINLTHSYDTGKYRYWKHGAKYWYRIKEKYSDSLLSKTHPESLAAKQTSILFFLLITGRSLWVTGSLKLYRVFQWISRFYPTDFDLGD